jgi:hypothetical protein
MCCDWLVVFHADREYEPLIVTMLFNGGDLTILCFIRIGSLLWIQQTYKTTSNLLI